MGFPHRFCHAGHMDKSNGERMGRNGRRGSGRAGTEAYLYTPERSCNGL
jgi:hypothetical protein